MRIGSDYCVRFKGQTRPVQPRLHSPCALADRQLQPQAASENGRLQTSVQTSVQTEKGGITVVTIDISWGDLKATPTVDKPTKQTIRETDRQRASQAGCLKFKVEIAVRGKLRWGVGWGRELSAVKL